MKFAIKMFGGAMNIFGLAGLVMGAVKIVTTGDRHLAAGSLIFVFVGTILYSAAV